LRMDSHRRVLVAVALLAGSFLCGTVGYMMIEGMSFDDAAYMTVITISTVGYKEVLQLSPVGRVFTMGVIMIGVGCMYYASVSLVTFFVGGELRAIREKVKVQKRVNDLKNHIVICGFGRMGRIILNQLINQQHQNIVLVDNDPEKTSEMEKEGLVFVQGDAEEESTLLKAGIDRAKTLVAVLPKDSDNVYVTLTARELKPDLFIITRAESTSTETKLIRAGADRVVCPQVIGAHRVSNLITKPNVVDFVDVAAQGVEFEITEYQVTSESSLAGQSLRESSIRQKLGAMVVAIKRSDNTSLFNPGPEEQVRAGDTLIMIGQLNMSNQLAGL